jgi:hypothetical protein
MPTHYKSNIRMPKSKGLTEKQKKNLPKALQQAILGKKKAPAKEAKGSLSPAMEKKLKDASKNHSVKHMNMMRKDIKGGMSFMKAHNKALKMVGK